MPSEEVLEQILRDLGIEGDYVGIGHVAPDYPIFTVEDDGK